MQLHLLLTDDIAQTKPETCIIIRNYGYLQVMFNNKIMKVGLHCIVKDTKENIVTWLKPGDGFVKGHGLPHFEQFSIEHIK